MDGVTTVTDSGVPPEPTTDAGRRLLAETAGGRFMPFRAGERICACRAWWAGLVSDATGYAKCPDCALLADGAPGEITEAWGR